MADWFVALAAQAGGGRVEDALAELGFRCYRPRYRERHVSRGRKSWREYFLLGHYVLVEFRMKADALGAVVVDWAHQFHEIIHTRGIRGALSADGVPFVVRDAEVARLRSSERRGFVPVPERGFCRGQQVFVQKGALVDTIASYEFSCDRFDYVTIPGLIGARVVKIPRGSIVAV